MCQSLEVGTTVVCRAVRSLLGCPVGEERDGVVGR